VNSAAYLGKINFTVWSVSTYKLEVTMESIIYVGVDVHKATNSVCMFDREHNRYLGEAARMEAGAQFLTKFLRKARKDFALAPSVRFLIGYEAGPTGFGLCRDAPA
jgi:hypothetical protein